MRKFLTIFAMLMAFSMVSLNAKVITEPKDTVSVVCDTASYFADTYTGQYFYLTSQDNTGKYYITVVFKGQEIVPGTFADTCLNTSSTYVQIYSGYKTGFDHSVAFANSLGDIVISEEQKEGTTFYNLTFPFVGVDSVLYDIDLTYHIPYEKTYHEAITSLATKDTIIISGDVVFFDFNDSIYRYRACVPAASMSKDSFVIGDSVCLYVYDVNDTTAAPERLYNSYSGYFTLTQVSDSTYSIVGEVLCIGDMMFYLNCAHPLAVDNVNMTSYNVFTDNHSVVINGAEGQNVMIYDMFGRMLFNSTVNSDYARYILTPGIYVVKINGSATKVLVK